MSSTKPTITPVTTPSAPPSTAIGPAAEKSARAGSRPARTELSAFLAALPKVELHVHLLGSASVDTVLELARRHPQAGVPLDPEALARFYAFRDFAHFIDVYAAVNALVRRPSDVTALVTGLGRDLAAVGVRYAEVTVTPLSHLAQGIAAQELADALTEGRTAVRDRDGVELAWVFDIAGELGPGPAWDTLTWVLRHRPDGTVGFGLGGPEVGVGRAQFTRHFTLAREAGLHSLPHAGETTGPATVWSALHDLGADRIGHGINSVTDPRLLDYLAEHRITLEVCPTSNLRTGAVPELAGHPLPRLLQAGVPVALSSDDPGMFDTDLVREYRVAAEVFGLLPAELAHLARTAIEASYCPEPLRTALLRDVDDVVVAKS